MRRELLFVFMLVILLTTVSADFLGTFQVDREMQITNYCNYGICTYINLTSLEYPNGTIEYLNIAMTKNGQAYNYSFTPTELGTYTFVTCGDPNVDICDKDTFNVNFNGEDNSIPTMIILLIFFVSLFMGYFYLNSKINYDKWYDAILIKYENKNYVKLILSSIGYNLIKNKLAVYYFLGFPVVLILTDIIMSYSINIFSSLFQYVIFVYSLGILVIAFSFFGQFQEFIMRMLKDFNSMSWGMERD